MKIVKILGFAFVILATAIIASVITRYFLLSKNTQPDIVQKIISKPLEKYQFENLINTPIPTNSIEIKDTVEENDDYTVHTFTHSFDPTMQGKNDKVVTGVINMPIRNRSMPIILMFRGYVDPEIYTPGVGTKRAAAEFAKAGFITVSPDFLGYGGSSENAGDIMESRFQTYTTALSILKGLETLPQWDGRNIFIWGHSNGGQIALTLLEITGQEIPTVLWAPVSKPFPYSVFYYTDESADKGKFLRSEMAKFENLYDVEKYSLDNYFDKITAPVELHQGGSDDAVPLSWSNELASKLKLVKNENYFSYPQADHNLMPDWDTVVSRNIIFFNSKLK
jgi:dipeptidyl aminopeptidase/acylaminoacyl peptidase